ncbi:MAG: 5-formyltetrahydrofolate cyclo-ligase [Sandarakinorhabdus sp.]|nr:5-formyltetrahydrofolate cyclo-ligase [Sandarakinorhabdus sp.]
MTAQDNKARTSRCRKAQRRQMREARAAFVCAIAPAVRRALEGAVASAILPRLGSPGILASYAAMGDELDPSATEEAARAAGWRIAYPRITPGAPLSFHEAARASLLPGRLGIPEPAPESRIVRPDVVLVPLIGADRKGNRLGQGGGFYDRTLAVLRASGPLLAIGLGWDVQIADHIRAEPWDQPLDAVATPAAFHLAGPGARRGG